MRTSLEKDTLPDAKGKVKVIIQLHDEQRAGGYAVKGNLIKSFTVYDAKVSEVFEKLRKLLT